MWMIEWRALSARIAAIFDSAKFHRICEHGTLLIGMATEKQPVLPFLRMPSRRWSPWKKFRDTAFLPAQPRGLSQQASRRLERVERTRHGKPVRTWPTACADATWASFQAEFEYLISDHEKVTKSLALRAFTHLQSSLAADPEYRKKWTGRVRERQRLPARFEHATFSYTESGL